MKGIFQYAHKKAGLEVVLLLLLMGAAAWAGVRSSASFRAAIDGLTSGGGVSSAASFRAPINATGEIAGTSQSAGFRMQAGVVQPIPPPQPPARIDNWKQYSR